MVHIIPSEDPLSRPLFGAKEQMLKEIYRYRRALKELKVANGKQEHDDEDGENKPSVKNKNRKKGDSQGDGHPK